jgi:hypothetical protein
MAPAAHVEPTADAPVPPPVNEGREASPPQSAEAAKAPASITEAGAVEVVVEEEGSLPPVHLLLKPMVSRLACLTSRPLLCKSRPSPRR